MAKINYDYCKENDIYNDGSIEQELLEAYKNNGSLTEGKYFYLTTNIRENILNWYPFEKDSTVLEVGAGVGCVTDAIAKKVKKVVSIEQSKRRCEVLYNRHKKLKNLEVVVGNLNDYERQEKFDYVVLIGVFEYAKMFSKDENPFVSFLNNLKAFLKPNGKILIAIENRYGAKYLFGGFEDHYGERFVGLEGYDNKNIQTFGKGEWINLMNECGFKNYKFYYPFPDYKMPSVIYSDKYLPKQNELLNIPIYKHNDTYYFSDYRKFYKGFLENDMFQFFSNSFLIEMSLTNKLSEVSFAKNQSYRSNKYNVSTIIYDDNKVLKVANNKEAIKHLKEIISINDKIKKYGIKTPEYNLKDNELSIEYIDGTVLSDYLLKLIYEKNISKLEEELDKYCLFLEKLGKDENGDILGLLDISFNNIIVKNNEYYLFDQEWYVNKKIPLKYSLYFSLKYLNDMVDNSDLFDVNKYYKKYKITKTDINNFAKLGYDCFKNEILNADEFKLSVLMNMGRMNLFYDNLVEDNYALRDSLNNLSAELEAIKNSKRYRAANKLANLKNKFIKK